MPRVHDSEVKELISVNFDTSNFIDTANTIVDEHLQSKIGSASLLTKIELYLAAHFVALTEERGGLIRDSFGDSTESYANVFKEGFRSTRFGQQALALDYTATLTAIGSGRVRAEFRVV